MTPNSELRNPNFLNFGVVIFPGSNCDTDCHWALSSLGQNVSYVWHQDQDLSNFDCLVLPGGFSYGDYLRSGAIARFSPVLKAIKQFAENGGLVIGICNGFQILLEAGLLPGAMLRNTTLKFICKNVHLRIDNNQTPFTANLSEGQIIQMPIAHNEGNYFVDEETLLSMKQNNQIILRYSNPQGKVEPENCPNGSLENIAGICNKEKNVFGLMPHPERAMQAFFGSADGKLIFDSIINYLDNENETTINA